MLVLSRKENQQIQIGDDVVLTVIRVAGDQVRIGIQAPREVSVMRTELLDCSPPASRARVHHSAPGRQNAVAMT